MKVTSRVIFALPLLTIIYVVGWAVTTYGRSSQDYLDQPGRYLVVAADGYALLVDTKTGCVWDGVALQIKGPLGTGSSVTKFRLVSVEGLYHVPTSAEESTKTPRTFPERCGP